MSHDEHRADPFAFMRIRWRSILAVFLLTLVGAGAYLMLATPQYSSTASLYVQPFSIHVAPGEKASAAAIPINFLNTQREIIDSVPVLTLALKPEMFALPTFERVKDPLTWMRDNLRVEVGKSDDIIHISLDSPYPQDAADLVQSVVDSYVEFETGQKKLSTSKSLKIYQKKKGEAEARVVDLDENMRQIQKKAGTLSFDDVTKNTISKELLRFHQDVVDAMKMTAAARADYDKSVLAWGNTALPTTAESSGSSSDPAIASSLLASQADLDRMPRDIIDAEHKLETLREKYLPKHPAVIDASERIRVLKLRYLNATRQYLRVAEIHEKGLRDGEAEEEKLADLFAESAAQYSRLEAEKKDTESESSMLGSRIKEVRLDEDTGSVTISPLEVATAATRPSRPDRPIVMLAAVGAGLFGGLLLALVRHQTDPYFRSAEEMESVIELPVLGCVPAGSRTAGNLNPTNPIPLDRWSDNAETCRLIASSLNAVCPKATSRVVLLTSPRSGDGRSTVARDLAIALATAGEHVLLLDADFQNPSLHALIGSPNTEGLANVIDGEISAELATMPTSIAGLDVLTTGSAPTLPAALFDSAEFESFLASVSEQYDRVLIDAPPVGGSNDARIAAAACGATLLVIPQRSMHKRLIRESRDRLLGFGARLVGVVMNDLPRRRKAPPSRPKARRTQISSIQTLSRMVADGHEKSSRSRTGSAVAPTPARSERQEI